MARQRPGRGADQFPLRLPDGMRDAIKAAADASGRSMNTEIIDRLTRSFGEAGSGRNIYIRLEVLPYGVESMDVPIGEFFRSFSQTMRDAIAESKRQRRELREIKKSVETLEDKTLLPPIDDLDEEDE